MRQRIPAPLPVLAGEQALQVRKLDGRTTVSIPDTVKSISVVSSKVDGQLCLLLYWRMRGARIVEAEIPYADESDEHLLEGPGGLANRLSDF